MNSYHTICKILNELTVTLPKIGDEVLFGKWKNRRAIIKKFKKDKNNQIVLITNKGTIPLFHVRLTENSYYPETDKYFKNLWQQIKRLTIPEDIKKETENCQSRSSDRLAKRCIGSVDNINVFLVNGQEVKQKYDMDFVEGGNDAVKVYIPKNEVWLDAKYDINMLKTILLHELSERYLMSTKAYSYEDAHDFANELECGAMKNETV